MRGRSTLPGRLRGRALTWILLTLAVLAVLLVAARAAAPALITRYANGALADLGEYRGHIDGVELSVLRGAARVRGITVEKKDSPIELPLAVVPAAEMTIQWSAILAGELVGEVTVDSPRVHFVQQAEDSQYGEGVDWRTVLEELTPVTVNRLVVRDGRVHFQNPSAEPPVDVYLSDLDVTVANLTNVRETPAPVYTTLRLSATAMEHAPLTVNARLDPMQEQPQFDLNFDLRDLDLVQLNAFLESYVNITAEAGTFSVAGEVAAAEGRYEGYVKPLLDGAEFLEPKDFKERPLGALWETVVAAASELFKNQPRDRVGTRVPISGEFTPDPDVWAAIGGVFRNMFDAFLRGVEGTIDLRDALESGESEESSQ
ncbi:MAG TPA: DUF748 domain-containing protein [Pseudomonadales bacterium]